MELFKEVKDSTDGFGHHYGKIIIIEDRYIALHKDKYFQISDSKGLLRNNLRYKKASLLKYINNPYGNYENWLKITFMSTIIDYYRTSIPELSYGTELSAKDNFILSTYLESISKKFPVSHVEEKKSGKTLCSHISTSNLDFTVNRKVISIRNLKTSEEIYFEIDSSNIINLDFGLIKDMATCIKLDVTQPTIKEDLFEIQTVLNWGVVQ